VHFIEVVSDDDLEIEELEAEVVEEAEEHEAVEGEHEVVEGSSGGTLATLPRAPRYHPFRVCGVLQGHKVTILIDSGATHNFIDEGLVTRMKLKPNNFERFNVIVADGFTILCTRRIQQLDITLGR